MNIPVLHLTALSTKAREPWRIVLFGVVIVLFGCVNYLHVLVGNRFSFIQLVYSILLVVICYAMAYQYQTGKQWLGSVLKIDANGIYFRPSFFQRRFALPLSNVAQLQLAEGHLYVTNKQQKIFKLPLGWLTPAQHQLLVQYLTQLNQDINA